MSTGTVEGIVLQARHGPEVAPALRDRSERLARPLAGWEVRVLNTVGETVARVDTDEQGRFRVELPVGDYLLAPRPLPGMLEEEGEPVAVRGGEITRVELRLDSGVRR